MIRWIALWLLVATSAHAADLTVLTAGAFKSVATELVRAYEASSGDQVILRNDTVGALIKRIKADEAFDVVIVSPAGLHELAQAGKVAAGSDTALAKVGVGVGVKAGAAKPDVATVSAFRTAMLQARSVAYIDPASGGSSGIYIATLFQNLGIAEAMAAKSVLIQGGLAAEAVVDGRAELVLQQISEIVSVPGVDLVGPLPSEIQRETIYAGSVAAASGRPEAARAFLTFLSGSNARSVLIGKGMQPP